MVGKTDGAECERREGAIGTGEAPGCEILGVTDLRHEPQFKFMAETMASGKIGKATAGHGTYGHGGPGWSGWFFQKGGGSLYDLGVYNVTTFTGLLGPVKEVVGMTAVLNPTRKVEDQGEIKVEADENTMLIMHHGNGLYRMCRQGSFILTASGWPVRGGSFTQLMLRERKGRCTCKGGIGAPAGWM